MVIGIFNFSGSCNECEIFIVVYGFFDCFIVLLKFGFF